MNNPELLLVQQKSVVGTIIMQPAAYVDAYHLKQTDFDPVLRPVWDVLQKLANSGRLVSSVIADTLRETDVMATLGDGDLRAEDFYLSVLGMADEEAFPTNVEKVMDAGIRAELNNQLLPFVKAQIMSGGKPARSVIDETIDWLITARRLKSGEVRFIGDFLPGFNQAMLKVRSGERPEGWTPSIAPVADIVGTVSKSEFIIVAGWGGTGKSSILRHDAIHAALDGDFVVTFDGEGDPDWNVRFGIALMSMLSDGLRLDTETLKRADRMTNQQWDRYNELYEKLGTLPWIIQPMPKVKEMEFIVKQLQARFGSIALVQVDQVQNLTETDFEKLETITYALRNLAMTVKIPVEAAHQLRRKSKGFSKNDEQASKFAKPKLEDLLYAGDHASKVAMMLYRVQMTQAEAALFPENKDSNNRLMDEDNWPVYVDRVNVAKNSSGKTGLTPELAWYRGLNHFQPLTPDWRSKTWQSTASAKSTDRAIKVTGAFRPAPKPAREERIHK